VLTVPRSHAAYCAHVAQLVGSFAPLPEHVRLRGLLARLDLSLVSAVLRGYYCAAYGRPALAPEDLLRSLVLMVLAGYTQIDRWVSWMRSHPYYAVLSGFDPAEVPGVGTFYDFLDRLLGGPPVAVRRRPIRLTRQSREQLRAEKHQPGKKHVALVTRLAKTLLAGGAKAEHWRASRVEKLVNQLLHDLCVRPAVATGLLPRKVGGSGDGMRLPTFANVHGRKLCACTSHLCDYHRRFTDPDASVGYDAFHRRFVYGHNFYFLTAWVPDSPVELPIYLLRATGKRSDAPLGPLALFRVQEFDTVHLTHGCFDGAHDAEGFYRLGAAWQIRLVIPLTTDPPKEAVGGIRRDPQGRPLCLAQKPMYPDGYHPERDRFRWRCPLMKGPERGDVFACPHRAECSTAKHGRMFYTSPGQDARLNTVPPRGTPAWKLTFNHRTASERTNSRQSYHLGLARTRTRGGNRWLFRTLLTSVAQYLLAWGKHQPKC